MHLPRPSQEQQKTIPISSCPNCPTVSDFSLTTKLPVPSVPLSQSSHPSKIACPIRPSVPNLSPIINVPVPSVPLSQISSHKIACPICPTVPSVPLSQSSQPLRPSAFFKQLLRTLILLIIRLLGAPGARTAAQLTRQPLPTNLHILLIRPDHLGDLVLATPVLHALKTHAPNTH